MTRAYLRLLVAGFRRQSAYLAAAWGGLVANVTFGFLKAAILVATVDAAGGELRGYDAGQMLAFVWVGQAMLGLVNLMGRDVLGERIRTGDVVVDFLRPLDLQLAGLDVPVGIFPGWLEVLARLTPFPSMLMTPIDVLTGRATGLDALGLVGAQLLWVAVVGGIGRALTQAGRRHLEVQGG